MIMLGTITVAFFWYSVDLFTFWFCSKVLQLSLKKEKLWQISSWIDCTLILFDGSKNEVILFTSLPSCQFPSKQTEIPTQLNRYALATALKLHLIMMNNIIYFTQSSHTKTTAPTNHGVFVTHSREFCICGWKLYKWMLSSASGRSRYYFSSIRHHRPHPIDSSVRQQ